MPRYDYLIIGGGMAADAAAHGIRERDANGTIGLISADPHAPYNRPPLSKALWKGDAEETVWRKTADARVDLRLGRTVRTLEADAKRVTDDRGDTYDYGKLLLATGGEPRRLAGAPEGVIYFRSLDDYRRTRALVDDGARFVVIGGGFIGAEVAAALRLQQRDVTMIVPEQGIGARVFPADLATFIATYYREKGVTVKLGDSVAGIEARGSGFMVRTKSAGDVEANGVVAGLGIVPNVDLATQGGLPIDNGIMVDEQLRTSRADVYAAGDVAAFTNRALGKRMRVEHEDNALTQGRMAGLSMAGENVRYDHLPFFYSDLFNLGYEAVGEIDARHEMAADWTEPYRKGVVYYLANGRVRGVLLWGIFGKVDEARALIADAGPFTAEKLKGRIKA